MGSRKFHCTFDRIAPRTKCFTHKWHQQECFLSQFSLYCTELSFVFPAPNFPTLNLKLPTLNLNTSVTPQNCQQLFYWSLGKLSLPSNYQTIAFSIFHLLSEAAFFLCTGMAPQPSNSLNKAYYFFLENFSVPHFNSNFL